MPRIPDRLKPLLASHLTPVMLAWAAVAALLVLRAWNHDFLALFGDTDDATRMLEVRDFLNGQNWFDHAQHRFNTPYGAEMHWSRLIDLPIAILIGLGNLLAPGHGERFALFAWPVLLLLPAFHFTAALARRLAGEKLVLVTLIIAALTLPVFSEFSPGRIDHHNVQIVLVLWLALETLNAARSNGAAWRAGIAAATSLAIGAETLPLAIAALLVTGLHWAFDPETAPRMRRVGFGFAGATLIHFLIATGPQDWLAARCDALSIVYLAAALGIAAAFWLLSVLPAPKDAWARRLGLGGASAALIALILFEVFPACAAGPFAALDPWLRKAWLANIVEARPLWASIANLPAYAIAVSLPVFMALGFAMRQVAKTDEEKRRDWLGYGILLLAATIGMALQFRGVRLAALLAAPGGAALIGHLRVLYLAGDGRMKIGKALGLVSGWATTCGVIAYALVGLIVQEQDDAAHGSPLASCLSEAAFAPLARLSPARIVAPIDLGPYILLMTPHSVVGSPYHRNIDGIADTLRAFGASEDSAWRLMERRGIDLVVMCDSMIGVTGNGFDAQDSLKALFAIGGQPDWLIPVTKSPDALEVYRFAR